MMIRWLKSLFSPPSPNEFLEKEPIILDVRSASEYRAGHIRGSRHVPLDQLRGKIEEVRKWGKPVLTCCATGRRSGIAAGQLKSAGIEAMNGGGWRQLDKRIQEYKKKG